MCIIYIYIKLCAQHSTQLSFRERDLITHTFLARPEDASREALRNNFCAHIRRRRLLYNIPHAHKYISLDARDCTTTTTTFVVCVFDKISLIIHLALSVACEEKFLQRGVGVSAAI